MSTLDAIVKLELTSMRAALGEEEHKLARCGSSGATWRSDVSMRETAVRLSEQGIKAPPIMEKLKLHYPNTKLPRTYAIQEWIK
jgi:hypothetical protein